MLCPRCNYQVVNGENVCRNCGFQLTSVLYQNQVYQYSYQEKKDNTPILDLVARLIALLGLIIAALSVFPRFYIIYDNVQSLSENIFSSFIEFAIYIWIMCFAIGMFCLPSKHKVLQGVFKLIVSIFGLLVCIGFTTYLHSLCMENNAPLAVGYFAFELRAGFYFMFIGFLICLISAIFSLLLTRKNK